jgi:hypothetical protein
MPSNLVRRLLYAFAIAAATTIALAIPAGAATASHGAIRAVTHTDYYVPQGHNGQQVYLCNTSGAYYKAFITGKNQNGQVVNGPAEYLLHDNNCFGTIGWWYKGTIKIGWWRSNVQFDHSSYCSVPTSQEDNWTYCYP